MDDFKGPECAEDECYDRAVCRMEGYCSRSNRVLPRVVVLEYQPPGETADEARAYLGGAA